MRKQLPLFAILLLVLLLPLVLQPRREGSRTSSDETLVIITPHNEAIRSEFGRAFSEDYERRTGRRVRVDWRTPGGTSEIARYLRSNYLAAFQNLWTRKLGRPWTSEIEKAWDNAKTLPAPDSSADTPEQQARRAFLGSTVGCGIDLFFGGGAFDFAAQAAAGRLVSTGFVQEHPEIFGESMIPQTAGGEPLWDKEGHWIGTCLGAFGICSNLDSLKRLGIPEPPVRWRDLTSPRYFQEVALANPAQSSSVTRSFELLIQEQMLEQLRALGGQPESEALAQQEGWAVAMRMLMQIGANARYFTDSSTKISLDVTAGDAAAGMTIDFYGRFQSDAVRRADGTSRVHYADAKGGTSTGADPIGMLRGAPHPELAKAFIAFVMSEPGQKLWGWKVGTPGGPHQYALNRLPILPALYAPEFAAFRTNPEVDPYQLASAFTYHEKWTSPLFRTIAFIFRVMCIDPHEELKRAWAALIEHRFPAEATRTFLDIEAVNYAAANGEIRKAVGDKLTEIRVAKELADGFRAQYRRAEVLAEAGR